MKGEGAGRKRIGKEEKEEKGKEGDGKRRMDEKGGRYPLLSDFLTIC